MPMVKGLFRNVNRNLIFEILFLRAYSVCISNNEIIQFRLSINEWLSSGLLWFTNNSNILFYAMANKQSLTNPFI